jgi:mannose-6-phosphate isomerase-like protein (cupin superfamily)
MTESTTVMAPVDAYKQWYVESSYQSFVRSEGAPLHQGSAVEDLLALKLSDWERRGGRVAYTRLADQEEFGLQVIEIPPGGELKPEHHMYDAVMFVLRGRGVTSIWQPGEQPKSVEWQEGSLLAIPLNAWHQEFNSSGTEPANVVMLTNMAQMINHYHNIDFIFNNPYVFADRYSANMGQYYGEEPKHWSQRLFETNFIPDVRQFGVDAWKEKGAQTGISRISMASTSLGLHILDIGEGTYAKAHRHDAGAHVLMVGGEGYELMYFEGEEQPRRVPLRPYGVIAPKRNEFHQHFNTGKGSMRHVALRHGPARYGTGQPYNPLGAAQTVDPSASGYQIDYEREDPRIQQEYYKELERTGVELRLPPVSQGRS